LGSSPYVADDHSIFISKVVPGGLAEAAGLKVSSASAFESHIIVLYLGVPNRVLSDFYLERLEIVP
jgi:hypothetical protein